MTSTSFITGTGFTGATAVTFGVGLAIALILLAVTGLPDRAVDVEPPALAQGTGGHLGTRHGSATLILERA